MKKYLPSPKIMSYLHGFAFGNLIGYLYNFNEVGGYLLVFMYITKEIIDCYYYQSQVWGEVENDQD